MLIKLYKYTALILLFALAGCSDDIKTVDYYKVNTDERISKITECDKSAESKLDVNCINAKTAHAKLRTELLLGEGIESAPYKN
jgi:hypothetical protein